MKMRVMKKCTLISVLLCSTWVYAGGKTVYDSAREHFKKAYDERQVNQFENSEGIYSCALIGVQNEFNAELLGTFTTRIVIGFDGIKMSCNVLKQVCAKRNRKNECIRYKEGMVNQCNIGGSVYSPVLSGGWFINSNDGTYMSEAHVKMTSRHFKYEFENTPTSMVLVSSKQNGITSFEGEISVRDLARKYTYYSDYYIQGLTEFPAKSAISKPEYKSIGYLRCVKTDENGATK